MEAMNQYSKASYNGVAGERCAEQLFSVEVDTMSPIDMITPSGCPVEVKTCARWIESAYTSTRRRRGRFVFSSAQHARLLSETGYYLLVILDAAGAVSRLACIPASDIFHPSLACGVARVSIGWSAFFGVEE